MRKHLCSGEPSGERGSSGTGWTHLPSLMTIYIKGTGFLQMASGICADCWVPGLNTAQHGAMHWVWSKLFVWPCSFLQMEASCTQWAMQNSWTRPQFTAQLGVCIWLSKHFQVSSSPSLATEGSVTTKEFHRIAGKIMYKLQDNC